MARQKHLVVVAHPDDELIFLWPALLLKDVDLTVLVCSDDVNNVNRPTFGQKRRDSFLRVSDQWVFEPHYVPAPSEFSRLPHRGTSSGMKLGEWWDATAGMVRALAGTADRVWTHNPHGEYGNTDHRLLFQLVAETVSQKLFFTDIRQEINWPIGACNGRAYSRIYARSFVGPREMTPEEASRIDAAADIYRKAGCWTWDFPIQKTCNVFQV